MDCCLESCIMFFAALCLTLITSIAMSDIGGWSPVRPVDPEVKQICMKVKPDIEKKTGTNFKVFTPLSFRSQVVAGTNYLVKVNVGGRCVHVKIFAALGGKLTVVGVQYPKAHSAPLVSF